MGGDRARTLTVGVMGHVDHGKTWLVRALTGVDTDRLDEEKRRGISIVLGFARLALPAGVIDLVDMPGHERFVRTMVAGATGIGAALLVIAADEGIKPQTVEHLGIAGLLGIDHGVVALTKIDAVPALRRAQVTAAIRELLAPTPFAAAAIVPVSATTGVGLECLGTALEGLLRVSPEPVEHGFFYLPIDRVFPVAGFGTVVTGTLRRGRIAVGDRATIVPLDVAARVRGLQSHGTPLQAAGPGRRVAVNLRGIEHHRLERGMALASPDLLAPSSRLDVALKALAGAPQALKQGARVRLLIGTGDVPARVRLLDRHVLERGDAGVAQLKLAAPQAVPCGEPFVLRSMSDARTLAGGRVLDPVPPRHRAGDVTVAAELDAVAAASLPTVLLIRLGSAGPRGCTLERLVQVTGFAASYLRTLLTSADVMTLADGTVVLNRVLEELEGKVTTAVEAFHRRHPAAPGMPREALEDDLAASAPGPTALEAILDRLASLGIVGCRRGVITRLGFDGRGALPVRAQKAAFHLESLFRKAGLEPPDEAVIVAGDRTRQALLDLLIRHGVLVRARDRVQGRSILFHNDAVAAAVQALRTRLPDPGAFLVRDAGAALGISRKYSIPLLEHLDRVGITLRSGDRRAMAPVAAASGSSQHPI